MRTVITRGNVVLRADSDGTGLGGGTVAFAPGTPTYTATGPNTAVIIYYSPSDYAAPTNYSGNFTLTLGATLNAYMWLYLQGIDKTYDASTAATLSFKGTPTAGGNDVTLVPGTATFNDKNAGTSKPITYSGFSVGGGNAGKFQLFAPLGGTVGTGTTAADITPLALTGSITAADKVYDGALAATILTRTLSAPIAGDSVSYSGGTAAFADKNVGSAKTVTATGLGLSGADAGNYTVNPSAVTAADITPLALTGQPAGTPSGGTLTDLFQGHIVDSLPLTQNSVGLASGELAGLNLTVIGTGVRMSVIEVPKTRQVQPAPPVLPETYVPPAYPPKQDRY